MEEWTSPMGGMWIVHIRIGREIKIMKFKGDASKMSGIVEVRGIVNKDATMSYGEFTQYDNEFGKHLQLFTIVLSIDLNSYEEMLGYYHGLCKDLCVK